MPYGVIPKVGDYLTTSFSLTGRSTPERISAVSTAGTGNAVVYTTTVPSGIYSVTPANTTLSQRQLIGTNYWILGA